MDVWIFINTVIWYCIGYVLSFVCIHICNNRYERELARVGITEALQLSFLSWLVVLICIVVLTGLDDKCSNFMETVNNEFEKLDNKFKGRN